MSVLRISLVVYIVRCVISVCMFVFVYLLLYLQLLLHIIPIAKCAENNIVHLLHAMSAVGNDDFKVG